MKSGNHNGSSRRGAARGARGGFTFVEILAAMIFVALVIPAAVKGIRIASDAGSRAERKTHALHLGEAMLNELVVTDRWRAGARGGSFPEPWGDYEWEVESRGWEGTELTELTMRVSFSIRGRVDFVQFSTLTDSTMEEE